MYFNKQFDLFLILNNFNNVKCDLKQMLKFKVKFKLFYLKNKLIIQ